MEFSITTVYLCAAITIQIDRRKTLGDLKQKLEGIVLVHATEFKVSCGAGVLVSWIMSVFL